MRLIDLLRYMHFLPGSGTSGGGGSTPGGGEDTPDDGKTRIYITLTEGRTSPKLGVGVYGKVTVDWGDGTPTDVLTGTNQTAVKWTPTHEYSRPGDYVISLSAEGTEQAAYGVIGFLGSSGSLQGSYLLRHSESKDGRNTTYQNSINRVDAGSNALWVGDYAFSGCFNLESITLGDFATPIGEQSFFNCYSLKSVQISRKSTSIGGSAFNNCYCLSQVMVPSSVTTISSYSFGNCYGVRSYDFTSHTAIPTLAYTTAFSGLSSDCEIRVPAALYDEWIAATNWTAYAAYIVPV